MKATEKIKLMMRLEKNFKKLDFEELHMIRDTLNKEIENKLADDVDIEISASDRENGFFYTLINTHTICVKTFYTRVSF